MQIVNKIVIDLQHRKAPPQIDAMQNDALTRAVKVILYDGGTAWEPPTGATVSLAYSKADKTSGWYDKLPDGSNACSVSGNEITALLAPQVLTAAGTVRAAIIFQDADLNRLATFPFCIQVGADPASGAQSDDYYNYSTMKDVSDAMEEFFEKAEAELQGIRVGYDGTQYSSAGEAVREQVGYAIKEATSKVDVIPGKNLFDKNAPDYVYNGWLTTTGQLMNNIEAVRFLSGMIAVEENTQYTLSPTTGGTASIACYDAAGNYIDVGGYPTESEIHAANGVITTPTGAAYLRFSGRLATVDNTQIEKGSVATGFEPYTQYNPVVEVAKRVTVLENDCDTSRVDKDGKTHANVGEHIRSVTGQLSEEIRRIATIEKTANYFNIDNAELGYRCAGDGIKTAQENSILSEWVEIPDGVMYAVPCCYDNSVSKSYRVLAYSYGFADVNKNPISGSGGTQQSALPIPDNAKYFRCSWLTNATQMLFIGFNTDGALIPYDEYGDKFHLKEEVVGYINDALLEIGERLDTLENDCDVSRVVCWGDSLTDGAGATQVSAQYPSVLKTLILANNTGINTINAGMGGEGAKNIATRQGAIALNVKPTTIPASGSINIELEKWHGLEIKLCLRGGNNVTSDVLKMMLNPCSIAGVTGTLLRDSNGDYVFTRSTDGEEVTFNRPVPLITYASTNLNLPTDINVFWVGTNDSNVGIEDTISVINLMIEKTASKKYIVVGLTWKARHQDIELKNQKMALAFGEHFLDIRQYMLEYGLADVGIEPTEQDLTDISNGEIPTSLRVDDVHGNDAFYNIVGNKVYQLGQYLEYWS